MCMVTSPARSGVGKTPSPTNSSPVSSTQFSLKVDCAACTIGPRSRTVGPRQPHREVAEVLAVLCLPQPLVLDAVPADEGDAAVDHHQLAMVALVLQPEVAQAPWMEELELAAGGDQFARRRLAHLVAARGIDEHAHLD